MPSTAIVHAAVFTVGAVIGAGAAATITHRRQQHLVSPSPSVVTPVVDFQQAGTAVVKGVLGGDVLKYGNPGKSFVFVSMCSLIEGSVL